MIVIIALCACSLTLTIPFFLSLITSLSEEFINNPKSAKKFLNNRREFLNARGFKNIDENIIHDNELIDLIVAFSDPVVNKAVKRHDLKLYTDRLKELNLYVEKNDTSKSLLLLNEEVINNLSLRKAIAKLNANQNNFTTASSSPISLGAVGFTVFVITAAVVFLGAVVVNYALGATLAAGVSVAITKHAIATSGNKNDKLNRNGGNDKNTALRVWTLKRGDATKRPLILNGQLEDKVESFINEIERAYPGCITNETREVVKNVVISNICIIE